MNFSASEFILGRQRGRQWGPLISQQFRLRHVYQIFGFNLLSETAGSYYFTLHLTSMSAPFYTSPQITNPSPKWPELDFKDVVNTSASCIVLRIWQHCSKGADKIILTWGVHFSGLVYIGNKIAEIQPVYFQNNAVIFCMQGGYYTSHHVIKTDLQKPIPFLNNVNLINTISNKVIYKRIAIKVPQSEVQDSYTLEKLRKLHSLQLEIKKKNLEVQDVQDKINSLKCSNSNGDNENLKESIRTSPTCNIRYAPQLLTMNSLNRMLQEKPTKVQKQEMTKISKEIEIQKFRLRLLSQERDRKNVLIRQLKQKHSRLLEENEERNFQLMENYHLLSREGERLKEYRKNVLQHRQLYSVLHLQLQQRRRKLLQELLFIYPILKRNEEEYTVHDIYLPKSDILADYPDTGLSVALGYITHILIMCSTFLQVPLRYPLTHYGSRSYVTDNVSPLLPEKERDFPLYTRGKDKAQFTYAVYLLNKNLAQLRWLFHMNTNDLKSTLSNLLSFLQGQREIRMDLPSPGVASQIDSKAFTSVPPSALAVSEKYVSLHSFASNPNVSDPILDSIRQENQIWRSSSPIQKPCRKPASKQCRNNECGRGLSEILAVPEAFLSKRISSDSFRNYIGSEKYGSGFTKNGSCCETDIASDISISQIKVTNGKEVDRSADSESERLNVTLTQQQSIEQGTDPLDPSSSFSSSITKSIDIQPNRQLEKKTYDISVSVNRICKSAGSYTDNESSLALRTAFEMGSDSQLNDFGSRRNESQSNLLPKSLEEGNRELLEKWLNATPGSSIYSDDNLYSDEYLSSSSQHVSHNSPLTARTDALLRTKSFNLVKPKP